MEERLSDPLETFVQITQNNSNNNLPEIFEPSEKNTQVTISQDKFDLNNSTVVIENDENIEPIAETTKKKYCLFKNSYFIKYLVIITCQW